MFSFGVLLVGNLYFEFIFELLGWFDIECILEVLVLDFEGLLIELWLQL